MIDDEVLALGGYVAHCAITPEPAGQILCLARLRPGDSEVDDATLRSFGWSDEDVPIDDARFGTPQGHALSGATTIPSPFLSPTSPTWAAN